MICGKLAGDTMTSIITINQFLLCNHKTTWRVKRSLTVRQRDRHGNERKGEADHTANDKTEEEGELKEKEYGG